MKRQSDLRFEWVVLKHLDAGFNLARWLTGVDQDAEDVVQDSAIRAFNSFNTFRGEDGKAWFLAIVRNTAYNRIRQKRSNAVLEIPIEDHLLDSGAVNPETAVVQAWEAGQIQAAVDSLPIPFREVVVLRELEEMSYKQIAVVTGLPLGTVMSRLARARLRLQSWLQESQMGEGQ